MALTSLLLGHWLVDEVVLIVYPVLPGRGKRMLTDTVGGQTRITEVQL